MRAMDTSFFKAIFGFTETNYQPTRTALLGLATFENNTESSGSSRIRREKCDFVFPDGRKVAAGTFSMPSVKELHELVTIALARTHPITPWTHGQVRVRNMVGEARELHFHQTTPAVFQAASQFNLLEFTSPRGIPEQGICSYVWDHTQGPACALACAAGTAYRNYLVPTPFGGTGNESERGQTEQNQLNCLVDVERVLVEKMKRETPPWKVKNGYLDSTEEELELLNAYLSQSLDHGDELSDVLRIGVQEDTAVTDQLLQNKDDDDDDDDNSNNSEPPTLVTQTYNSAVAVGYSRLSARLWERFARVVLNGTYEATLLVGLLKTLQTEPNTPIPPIYLTKVGGGVFQNHDRWIIDAIDRAVEKVSIYRTEMDIRIVHYGAVETAYAKYPTIDFSST